ncbi:hypothetical protein JCM19297_1073 [Nonlabens ulvanivorans]|nr:hypothetical protein [Nonlabens ulvanivorans]GAK89245.1 hypothetical protein JCM19297_1073 [Nonlabens ulvanivorans]
MDIVKEKITLEDNLIGLFYKAQHSKEYQAKLLKTRLTLPLIWSALVIVLFIINDTISWFGIILLIISIFWFFFYPLRYKRLNIKHYRKYLENKKKELGDSYTEEDIFYLDQTDFKIYSDGIELSIPISRIEKLVELNTHLILFIKAGGLIAFNKTSDNYDRLDDYFKSINIPTEQDLNWSM